MFSEFGNGGEGISKERFGIVMRDILLGLGDGLEREPVAISALDGTRLQEYGNSPEFEVDAITAFSTLDTDMKGSLPSSAIKTAMQRLSVDQGMPPQTDVSVTKSSTFMTSFLFRDLNLVLVSCYFPEPFICFSKPCNLLPESCFPFFLIKPLWAASRIPFSFFPDQTLVSHFQNLVSLFQIKPLWASFQNPPGGYDDMIKPTLFHARLDVVCLCIIQCRRLCWWSLIPSKISLLQLLKPLTRQIYVCILHPASLSMLIIFPSHQNQFFFYNCGNLWLECSSRLYIELCIPVYMPIAYTSWALANPCGKALQIVLHVMRCLIVGCCWIEQVSEQIEKAFKMAGIQGDQSLNQYDFVDVYRKAVLALAECLKGNPLTVAHTEKTFDGSSITALLKDKPTLDAVSISNSTKQNKTK